MNAMLPCLIVICVLTILTIIYADPPRADRSQIMNALQQNIMPDQNGNPYLYPCTSNSDCTSANHECDTSTGINSSYWFCNCFADRWACSQNSDCCTNICYIGGCESEGGTQGCYCTPPLITCAAGYICQPWGTGGYCNYNGPTTTPTSLAPTTSFNTLYNCAGMPDGNYPDPNNKCSAAYYICANGQTYNQTCPGNLIFNPCKDICD